MSVKRRVKNTRRLSRYDFLLKLMNIYKNEADKCGKVRAYLAGCIILGAALEAGLLGMAKCYPEKVKRTKTYQQQKKMDDLGLFDLIKIATELHWIRIQVDRLVL